MYVEDISYAKIWRYHNGGVLLKQGRQNLNFLLA